jgi:endoglycosylceramidase
MNEPAPGSQDFDTFETTTLASFYTQMVAHMRQAAPATLVFLDTSPLDASSLTTSIPRPAGDGIVFAPHFYPTDTTPANVAMNLHPWAQVGASWNVPVFIGEFGEPRATMGVVDYDTAVSAALDSLAMSGTQWEYSQSTEEWNSESWEVVAADGTEYPIAQPLVRPFARAVAGSSITQSWVASSSTFTLSYQPAAGGTTEVQLPSRAYPQGFRVEVTGGCYDSGSMPGRLLVQADAGAAKVTLTISP